MFQSNTLEVLKQCFEKIVPFQDARTTINPLEFIVCLVYRNRAVRGKKAMGYIVSKSGQSSGCISARFYPVFVKFFTRTL